MPARSDYDRAVADITAAHQRARAVIEATDGTEAFGMATELRDTMERLADADADLRAATAARIARAEELSLAGLADRISVSKPRAQQLVRRARDRTATTGGN